MISKKYIIIIFIIIVLVCGLGLYAHSHIKVGNIYVTPPNGYHSVTDSNGVVNLSNGKESLILNEYSGDNLDEDDLNNSINYYKDMKEKENLSVKLETFNVNDVKVYQTIVNNGTKTYHYWFLNEGKIYEFVASDGANNTKGLASDLIKSMHKSIL